MSLAGMLDLFTIWKILQVTKATVFESTVLPFWKILSV